MDAIQSLIYGLELALQPSLFLAAFVGAFAGTLIGVIPGLGPIAGAALILPLTFQFSPSVALIMIAGIYLGAQYGGSTTSVILNIPGDSSAVVATFDGYAMTQKGRGGAALMIMAVGSFIAGTIGLLLLTFMSPLLSTIGLLFGAPEFFALTAGGLLALARVSAKSLSSGLFPMILGVMFGTVGQDFISGTNRFTFGSLSMSLGFSLVAVAIGLYGLSEMMILVEGGAWAKRPRAIRLRELTPSRKEWRKAFAPWTRGSLVGFGFGLLPVPSTVLSTFTSYKLEKSISRNSDEFGNGAIQGIAGPEASNNSAAIGSLAPILVLGLPFSATLALMLSAMIEHGIQPGPLLMSQHPEVFWGVVASMYVANVMLLVLNVPLVGLWVQVLRTPQYILVPIVVIVALIGAFNYRQNMVEVYVLLAMGALGYVLRKFGFSLASLIIGLLMGPLIEKYMLEGLYLSGGDLIYFLSSPTAIAIWVFALFVAFSGPLIQVAKFAARHRCHFRFPTQR